MSIETTTIPSIIGRLLHELSWTGKLITQYRGGGRGFENVLSAEVLQALDFLPRAAFFGALAGALHGGGQAARKDFRTEAEHAEFFVLPGEMFLQAEDIPKVEIQPHAIITTSKVYCLVEAKRIRSSFFQPRQLAREFVMALRLAIGRHPLLLLLLSSPPPVRIRGRGKLSIRDAIMSELPSVFVAGTDIANFEALIEETVCWITWNELAEQIERAKRSFHSGSASADAVIERLANSALNSVKWHGNASGE
jgi:hypothetical protein